MKKTFSVSIFVIALIAAVFFVNNRNDIALKVNAVENNTTVTVEVKGSYYANIQDALDRINEIRYEACSEGIENPSDPSTKLTLKDYHPIKWSSELEKVARLRAAESILRISHTRPNDQLCWSALAESTYGGNGEVLAWNFSKNLVEGINQFYAEKYDWVNHTGNVTGHYTQMIDPDNNYVGMGGFYSEECGVYSSCTCGRFSNTTIPLDETRGTAVKDCTVPIEISAKYLSDPRLDGEAVSINVGENTNYKLWATTNIDNAYGNILYNNSNVKWISSDNSILTVNSGKITGKKGGSAIVTAVDPTGKKASVRINVIRNASSVSIDQSNVELEKGKSILLKGTVLPEDTTNKTLTWTSSDKKVVSVSAGKITAVGIGTANVTCKTHNGKTASCKITVFCYPEQIKLNNTTVSLGIGESYQLNAEALPSNARNRAASWRTSDSRILRVTQSGKVSSVGKGTAWITARTANGIERSCKITVKNAPSKVDLTKGILTIGVGEKFSIGSTVNNGAASSVRKYRTSNSSVVKMTRTDWKGEFVGVKPGVAYVTVRTYNGIEKACKVTVKSAPGKVNVSRKTITLRIGQTASLNAYIDSNAGCASRTFRSSNSKIVKMTKTNWSGSFKAMKLGIAWVTVRTYNGREASCKIIVTK